MIQINLTADIDSNGDSDILVLLMADALEAYIAALRREAKGGPVVSTDGQVFESGMVKLTSYVNPMIQIRLTPEDAQETKAWLIARETSIAWGMQDFGLMKGLFLALIGREPVKDEREGLVMKIDQALGQTWKN